MPYCIECGASVDEVNSRCDTCRGNGTKNITAVRSPDEWRTYWEEQRAHGRAVPVVVVDFDMSFGNMVRFLVKLAIAAIPAAIIIGVIWAVIAVILLGMTS